MVGVLNGIASALPLTVLLSRDDGFIAFDRSETWKAALTGFQLAGSGAVTAGLTLRQKIYAAVVGGENPGQARLSGVWFAGVCPAAGDTTGVDGVLGLYEGLRFATTGRACRVTIARSVSLTGLLTKFQMGTADPATGAGEFSFDLVWFPRGITGEPSQAQLSAQQSAMAGASL